jgi:hypothetical protein
METVPLSKRNGTRFHVKNKQIDTCLDRYVNIWKASGASAYLLDEHPRCLSSHLLAQVPVPYVHQTLFLTWE